MKKLIGPSLAEFFGTLVLVFVVVGSGIMGTNLSAGNLVPATGKKNTAAERLKGN